MTDMWTPPPGPDIAMRPAGVAWDAVKFPEDLGDEALLRLGAASGAVIRDPWGHHLYWLIEAGAATGWRLPHTTVLGPACYLAVPPAARTYGPGPHWAVAPSAERQLTCAALLHDTLRTAVASAPRPRAAVTW